MKINKQNGFTLIELMVAMVIGMIVLLGLVSLFTNVSVLNKAQTGLSILQENGRYAISRLKQDIESAGQKHCASVALPTAFITNWDQGYEMKPWYVASDVNFALSNATNGLPTYAQIRLDSIADVNQLSDTALAPGFTAYPLDSSFFLRGHECNDTACTPAVTSIGSDQAASFRTLGVDTGDRLPFTDIITMRYLTGGTQVTGIAGNVATTTDTIPSTNTGNALIADCNVALVTPATWAANAVTTTNVLPAFAVSSDTAVYSMDQDFKTISYFVGVDDDEIRDDDRVIPSLYRSENGVTQQIVEGVERFDVFYLAQLQTGVVVRLTADQVQSVSGGGDLNNDGAIDGDLGCTLPATIPDFVGFHMPNDPGCLWRSIYAVELYLLLNTVNDSSNLDNDSYIYSVDQATPQDPSDGMLTGLPAERMYRREFSAIVPIRNYTL
ncbi:prepilin-type N-terminal cleavage/methylation domain-containing protein [Marinicella litoralis]|nr:prepilin-type N-terminal cleavage/methylation domain-containing protein [Marinicella litoralis]